MTTCASPGTQIHSASPWDFSRWLRLRHFQRLIPRLAVDLTRAHILDAGCGYGDYGLWLAQQYPRSLVKGIDADNQSVEIAGSRALARHLRNAEFQVATLEKLSSADRFDLICLMYVLDLIPDDQRALEHLGGLLASGGILLVGVASRLGADPSYGFRRLKGERAWPSGLARNGYSQQELASLMKRSDLKVLGSSFALAPHTLFVHTAYELLAQGSSLGRLLAPAFRLFSYGDFAREWPSGGLITMWGAKPG